MARALERHDLFTVDRERKHFLDILATARENYGLRIHAYVLMRSHYHLVVQTPRANLSEAMQWINLSYAAWYNRRHERVGPVFAGRYNAIPVEDGTWAYELSIYVHLNPLRIKSLQLGRHERLGANLGMSAPPSKEVLQERLRRLRSYRWSSYRAYAGYEPVPEWLTAEAILLRAAPKGQDQSKAYRTYAQKRLAEGGKSLAWRRCWMNLLSARHHSAPKSGQHWASGIGRRRVSVRCAKEFLLCG